MGKEAVPGPEIRALFLDIGGVLLTNGWDRGARRRACEEFGIEYEEMNERHHLTFDAYEEGRLSLETYLDRVVFHEPRDFSREQFRLFMFAQSQPLPHMLEYLRGLKAKYGLKVATVSNEGRELTVYRIARFALTELVDFFVCSCFIHHRKPDEEVFGIALDLAQVPVSQVVYLEDRALFAEIAGAMGMRSTHHTSYESTRRALEELGLVAEQ